MVPAAMRCSSKTVTCNGDFLDEACREASLLHLRTAGRRWWLCGCPVDARAVLLTGCLTPHAYLLLPVLVIPLGCTIIESGFPGQDFCISEQTPDRAVEVIVLADGIMVHAELPLTGILYRGFAICILRRALVAGLQGECCKC